MKRLAASVLLLGVAILTSCSSEPQKPAEKPQPKPPEYVTGRTAFQKLYIAARGWAPDAKPFKLQSQNTADSKGHDGSSAVWRASFASVASHGLKPYVWSGTNGEDAPPRGITFGSDDSYNPNNASTQVFDIAFLKIDSDKALEIAQKHGGEKLLQKSPETPVLFVLQWEPSTNTLIWQVIYGISREEAKLKVNINASTSDFIEVEK